MSKQQLTIEHLAPYLPYNLKVIMEGEECNVAWMSTKYIAIINPYGYGDFTRINWFDAHKSIKPILRPLSDLTKEIEHNGEKFVPLDYLNSELYPLDYFEDTDHYDYLLSWVRSKIKSHHVHFLPHGLVKQLLEWHFDVFSLIEKGLAINLNEVK